ncbi:MAG: hypothetical protein V4711_09570 [Pseudomonadota bacterium]
MISRKDALRDALLVEELRMQRVKWRYAALSKKIQAYSDGGGEPPTPEEFTAWIDDGKELERISAMQLAAVKAKSS